MLSGHFILTAHVLITFRNRTLLQERGKPVYPSCLLSLHVTTFHCGTPFLFTYYLCQLSKNSATPSTLTFFVNIVNFHLCVFCIQSLLCVVIQVVCFVCCMQISSYLFCFVLCVCNYLYCICREAPLCWFCPFGATLSL